MKFIPLTRGLFVKVDDHWFDYLMQWEWFAQKVKYTYYAVRNSKNSDGTKYNKRVRIEMHRVIMATPDNQEVDHVDHDGLNNLEENMRNATHSQNRMNKRSIGESKYLGVSFHHKKYNTYILARITTNNGVLGLGYFKTEEDAARAYDKAAKIHHKEFANLNFPNE